MLESDKSVDIDNYEEKCKTQVDEFKDIDWVFGEH